MMKPNGQQPTVLVADDDENYRNFLRDLLEPQGYRVVCAPDGEEALKIVASQSVDLALVDVMMPRRNGFSTCQALKSNPETRLIPVLLITGLNSTEDHIRGIEAGADDFLSKPVRTAELRARVRSLLKLKQFTDEMEYAETVINSLALSIEAKDPYTKGHCERLSKYAVALGGRLGLPEEERIALYRGGIIHDIGKVAVPESILLKPGPLTAEERLIMEQHPAVGEHICAPLKSFRLVLPIIRHHHEHLDGSGYPDGLIGDQIPLTARVLTTVDVYDALTTRRPYRNSLSRNQAFAVMKEEAARGWWDGSLLNEFQRLINESSGTSGEEKHLESNTDREECHAVGRLP